MTGRSYSVKEIYLALQGEGAHTGRTAVLCRFAGCNLWSGKESDRSDAACDFCDTDFVGTDGPEGGQFEDADQLADAIARIWPGGPAGAYVVFTGGEPLLQLDRTLIDACHSRGLEIAVETNGTIAAPAGIDWLTVSPKPNSEWVQKSGDELKLVYPLSISPDGLDQLDFAHFFLQPLDGPNREQHTRQAIEYCLAHPRWRLSLQTHKLVGIP